MIQIISINFQQIDDSESKSEFEYFFLSFEISNSFQQIDDSESESVFEYSFFSFDTFSSESKFSFSNSFSILRASILNSNFNHRKQIADLSRNEIANDENDTDIERFFEKWFDEAKKILYSCWAFFCQCDRF